MFGDCPMDSLQGLLNIARNSKRLLCAPSLPKGSWPIISVGSGPSLARHLPALRELQHKCVIIASLTAVQGLRENGIQPHLATPTERTEDIIGYCPADPGTCRFGGAYLVANSVLSRFSDCSYIPNLCSLSNWCTLPGENAVYYGSSTGTMSVGVATMMSTGPVYLVGHDLAMSDAGSHWNASTGTRDAHDGETIEGNNGQRLPTHALWKRFAYLIGETARCHGNVVNVNALDGIGAKIAHALDGSLPDPASLPDLAIDWGQPNERRLRHWQRHAQRLPRDVRRAIKALEASKFRLVDIAGDQRMDGLDVTRIVGGPNGFALNYILVGIYAQLSYQCRLKITSPDVAFAWGKSALLNVLRNGRPVFQEIADHAAA